MPLLTSFASLALGTAAIICAALFPGPLRAEAEHPVTVFAAASLTDVFEAIGALHQEAGGTPIRLSFASSSTLARQIEAGAPAQIYASANERWMDHVEGQGLIAPGTRVSPIGNALTLIVPADSPIEDVALGPDTDLLALLQPGERIALGDPDHVPAGLYAREALDSLGLWEAAEGRLARSNTVRAAMALVETGEAPLGIVYATDAALSESVRVVGQFPQGSHTPVAYPFAIIAGQDTPAVRAVYETLLSPEAQAIFAEAGFTLY